MRLNKLIILADLMEPIKDLSRILVYPTVKEADLARIMEPIPIGSLHQITKDRMKQEFMILDRGEVEDEDVFCRSRPKIDRYADITPYKHNSLTSPRKGFSLNASLMVSFVDKQPYAVFSQAPSPAETECFWEAVYRLNVRRIFMLCAFNDPVRGVQAEPYWPELKQTSAFKTVGITVENVSEAIVGLDCKETRVILMGDEGKKELKHIHWSGWKDMAKPLGEEAEQLFLLFVKDLLALIANKEQVWIHCSAGVGRTGTLGSVVEAARMAATGKVSVPAIVDNMRRNRAYCVQTLAQYEFIYQQIKLIL